MKHQLFGSTMALAVLLAVVLIAPVGAQAPSLELWEEACHEGERDVDAMVRAGTLAKKAGRTGIHTHDVAR
jgi:hypothetical protein